MTNPAIKKRQVWPKPKAALCSQCGGWALYPIITADYPKLSFCSFKCYGEHRYQDLADKGKARIKNLP